MPRIIDSHLDLAWNALSWERDLTLPLGEIRAAESGMIDKPGRGVGVVCLPEMRRGGMAVCFGTLLVRAKPERPREGRRRPELDYATQEMACAVARGQLAYYRLLEERGEIAILRNRDELEKHWAQWPDAAPGAKLPVGVILAMEGADPIVSPQQVRQWHELGLRCVGLAHYGQGHYAHGTGGDGPLTPRGRELLREMARVGMILDLTHCADTGWFEAIELYDGPVLASHNNCRALVPGDRQFSDEQIRRLVGRGGVIGVALDAWMLLPGWKRGQTPREAVTLGHVADQIDRICQIAGNADHVGIGSDLDGGFGTEQTPLEIESIADLQKLEPLLAARGYGQHDIDGIFHGNWQRFLTQHLPA
jgi:membrane dipeptidase